MGCVRMRYHTYVIDIKMLKMTFCLTKITLPNPSTYLSSKMINTEIAMTL